MLFKTYNPESFGRRKITHCGQTVRPISAEDSMKADGIGRRGFHAYNKPPAYTLALLGWKKFLVASPRERLSTFGAPVFVTLSARLTVRKSTLNLVCPAVLSLVRCKCAPENRMISPTLHENFSLVPASNFAEVTLDTEQPLPGSHTSY